MGRTTLKARVWCRLRSWTGVQQIAERKARGGAVLVYHGVLDRIADPDAHPYCIDRRTFQEHLAFFRKTGEVVPLSWIVDRIQRQTPVPAAWFAITMDDALHCQTSLAAELLNAADCPWALAVPAGLVGTGRTLWTNEIRFLFLEYWRKPTVPHPDPTRPVLLMSTRSQRSASLRDAFTFLRVDQNVAARLKYVERLIDEAGRDEFLKALNTGDHQFTSWADLRRAAASGVELLAHGLNHLAQTNDMSTAVLDEEIAGARRQMTENLGIIPFGYALPFGQRSPRTTQMLKDAGFQYCLTSTSQRVTSMTDPFAIPRFDAEYPLPVLRRHLVHSR